MRIETTTHGVTIRTRQRPRISVANERGDYVYGRVHGLSKRQRDKVLDAAFELAATPGRYYKDRTHRLRQSTRRLRASVSIGGPTAPYARFLEFGTSKMRPRAPLQRSLASALRSR